MKFKQYISECESGLTGVAAQLNKPVTTVHGWASGRRVPRAADLVAIEALTDGKVTAKDFVQEGAVA